MNAMFDDIQQSDDFVRNLEQTSTDLITQQLSSFEVVQIVATIQWIKPTTNIATTKAKLETEDDGLTFGGVPFGTILIIALSLLLGSICCFICMFVYKSRKNEKRRKDAKIIEMDSRINSVQSIQSIQSIQSMSDEDYGENNKAVKQWLTEINMKK